MTEPIIMDGEPLEVGDRVWCLVNGWGKVEELNMGVSTYQIDVNFNGSLGSYTQDFRFFKGTNRTLYWDEIKITPPSSKSKKNEKVWDWFAQNSLGTIWRINGVSKDVIESSTSIVFYQKIDGTEREVIR